VPESSLRDTKHGRVYDGDGWFVINAREARWGAWDGFGVWCNFEGKRRFPHFGFNINVLQPGESLGRYHFEKAQEDFLVVAGRCVLIVEEEERELAAWDFVHCPPGTAHIIVSTGSEPAVVIAAGARGRGRTGIVYPVSEVAARHRVSVSEEASDAAQAYADLDRPSRVRYGDGWLPDF
jgi:uncharacterized cupin superfamily protein